MKTLGQAIALIHVGRPPSERWLRQTESPIERELAISLSYIRPFGTSLTFTDASRDTDDSHWGEGPRYEIEAQQRICQYRPDFVIVGRKVPGPFTKLAVECDGYWYHAASHVATENDRRRDLVLASLGYQVLRFTGAEIRADPHRCADMVESALEAEDPRYRSIR